MRIENLTIFFLYLMKYLIMISLKSVTDDIKLEMLVGYAQSSTPLHSSCIYSCNYDSGALFFLSQCGSSNGSTYII